MSYLLYLPFGLLPSLIWLAYFLRKDVHPESKQMILKIFSLGVIVTLPAIFLEIGIFGLLKGLNLPQVLFLGLYFFLGVAFVEEFLKYLVVRGAVITDPEFDEPVDAMLYMIISALGFAALENILVLFNVGKFYPPLTTFTIAIFRFVGATFLHALTSGTIGYFLALSFFVPQKKKIFLFTGFGMATILHGFYNLSIIQVKEDGEIIIPFLILLILALFVHLEFRHLKKLKSICKIK